MEVILKQDVEGLGKAGEAVRVADGYGRNYLIPRKLAVVATEKAKKNIERELELLEARKQKEKKEAQKIAQSMGNISCTIKARAGENEKLFGSVTTSDIAEALRSEGVEVDRKNIVLEEPIKELGVFSVPIKVHHGVTAEVKVWVIKE